MSSIVLSGDTSGSVTVSVPAVSGSNTVTIPATTGTVMVSSNMPAFSAYLSANQSVSTGVTTKVALNVEDFDTANCFDSTTNYRFTPNVAGYYQFNLNLLGYSSSTAITQCAVYLYKNGAAYIYNQNAFPSGVVVAGFCSSIVAYANGTTDYFEMYGNLTGSSLFFSGSSQRQTSFTGSLIRSA